MSRKPLTPGYENEEGPHHQHDAEGNLIVDFSGSNESAAEFSKAARTANERQIDPATGYSKDMVWTTKDHRRIPIPHMQDSHLLNTIAFLRRRVEPVYKKMLIAKIIQGIISNNTKLNEFDWLFGGNDHWQNFGQSFFEDMVKDANASLKEQARQVYDMDADTFLRTYSPQFPNLYQEAYKRKLLIEVDPTKLSGGQ